MGLFFNRKSKEPKNAPLAETIEQIQPVQQPQVRTSKDLLTVLDTTAIKIPELYNVTTIKKRIKQFPELVVMLLNMKDSGNNFVFNPVEINAFLSNADELETDPKYVDKVKAVLSNPKEVVDLSSAENKGYGLLRSVRDPFDSTIQQNPEAFSKPTVVQQQPHDLSKGVQIPKPTLRPTVIDTSTRANNIGSSNTNTHGMAHNHNSMSGNHSIA